MTTAPSTTEPDHRAQTESDLGAQVVLGLHRLTKGATLYASDNQAAVMQLERARQAVIAYGKLTQINPKLFFTEKSVFVGGRLLRAGRAIYASALELGKILRRFGVDEVAIGFDVGVDDLRLFQTAMADALRGQGESPANKQYARIRLRRGQAPGKRKDELSPDELVLQTYAAAIIVMRRFLESIQRGEYHMPIGVRRVAQQLAELSAIESPAFLGTTAIYNAKHEHSGRAVNSALVALAMARQLTDDKRLLARIATGALLYDVGIPRVSGSGPMGQARVDTVLATLIEDQVSELPASTAATLWAVGGFGDTATMHTVLVYEAVSLANHSLAPRPYDGLREPSLSAQIVATARRFNEHLANPDRPVTPNDAICRLLRDAGDEGARTSVRLLASALGLFPVGSLVKLSTGEVAQVVRVSDNPMLFSFPTVRPVLDARGAVLKNKAHIDLCREETAAAVHITALVELADDSKLIGGPPEPQELALELDESSPPAPSPPPPSPPRQARPPVSSPVRFAAPAPRPSPVRPATPAPRPSPVRVGTPAPKPPPLDDELQRYLLEMDAVPPRDSDVGLDPPAATAMRDEDEEDDLDEPDWLRGDDPVPTPAPGPSWVDLEPTAQGSLTKTPLVHLLVYSLDRGLTGTIVLKTAGDAQHFIYLAKGIPSKVRTEDSVYPLDEVLRELELVDDTTLDESLAALQSGELHGQQLVSRGLLDADNLAAALQCQLVRKVSFMLALPHETTTYAYYEKVNALHDYGGPELTPIDPLFLIAAGVRYAGDSSVVHHALARLGTQPLRLHADVDISRFGFEPGEMRVVEHLRARAQPLLELTERHSLDSRTALLTVYALMITRSLKLAGRQKPPVGVDRKPIAPRWVEPDATRPSGPGPRPSPTQARPVVRRKRDTHPHQSAAVRAEPAHRDPKARPMSPSVLFQKAKLAFMNGSYADADRLVKDALAADPEEPEYRALSAWVQAHVLGPPASLEKGKTTDHYDEQIRLLDKAIAADDHYAMAIFYRAQLLQRSGFIARAVADFRRVVELDPDNAEAASAVEELEMGQSHEDKIGQALDLELDALETEK